MSDFKIVKLADPIFIATNGVAQGALGTTYTSGTVILSGGNNITLSTNGNTIAIHGGAGAGGGVAIGASNTTYQTGTVVFEGGSNVTVGKTSNSITIAAGFSQSTQLVNTSQSSLFQHTSATSNITSNALHNSQSSLFQHTSATSAITSNAIHTSNSTLFQSTGNYLTSQSNQALSAANGSFTFQTASFANSNGISFSTGTQGIYGTVQTDYANSTHTHSQYLNTSQSSLFQHTSATSAITSNALHTSQSSLFQSTGNYLTSQSNQAVSFTSGSVAFQTLSFTNSNGVSFNSGTQGVFASVKTDYMSSEQSSNFMGTGERNNYFYTSNNTFANSTHSHGNPTLALTNLSGTTASASNGLTISLSAAAGGGGADGYNIIQGSGNTAGTMNTYGSATFVLAGGANITLSQSSNTMSIIGGAGGGGADGYNIIGVNGGATALSTTLRLSDANNVSFGINAGTITASASYPTQTVQTQGMVSVNGSTGNISFANGNNVTFGANGSTITASASYPAQTVQPVAASASNGSYLFSTLKFVEGSGVTWATQANGIQASVKTDYQSSNANYLTSQSNQAFSASGGSSAFQTLNFANSNGITFSNSNGSVIASHNGLTTARASNDAVGLNTAATNVTWTVNSGGISLNAGAYLTTAQPVGAYLTTARASNDAVGLNTAGTNITWTVNSSGISINAGAYLTTAQPVGAYLTTARASNDAIGLNTAGTNVTWTVNSSGLSFNGGGYAGTGTSATNASITLNSNGLAISVAAPGAAAENNWFNLTGNTAGNSTASGSTIVLSAGNNITLSATNGSVIRIDAGGGGGGIAMANSQTTYTSGTAYLSGAGAITIQSTTGQSFQLSVPAQSSLSATGHVSLSTNGSTISIGAPSPAVSGSNGSFTYSTLSFGNLNGLSFYTSNGSVVGSYTDAGGAGGATEDYFRNHLYMPSSATTQALNSTFVVFPIQLCNPVSFHYYRILNSISLASTSFASTANTTLSFNQAVTFRGMLFSRGTGASSQSLQSVSTWTHGLTQSYNVYYGSASNTSQGQSYGITYPMASGTASFSTQYNTSNVSTMAISTGNQTRMTGMKFLDFNLPGSLSAGEYWVALNASTASTTQGTNMSGLRLLYSTIGLSQVNLTLGAFGNANNASIQLCSGVGSFTTAGGATTGSMGISNISSAASHVVPLFELAKSAY